MGEPGHEFLKGQGCCTCGWKPEFRGLTHPEVQWSNHLAQIRHETKAVRRIDMSRETAIEVLRSIACKTGDATIPTEDVIDIAQAVLALIGDSK